MDFYARNRNIDLFDLSETQILLANASTQAQEAWLLEVDRVEQKLRFEPGVRFHSSNRLIEGGRTIKYRHLERRCVTDLLALYAFAPDDYTASELPVTDGRWQTDLFSKEAITEAGLSVGKGAAVGAVIHVLGD